MKPRGFQYMADVSSNNGEISIPSYSRAGHVIIAIKATQGKNYVNPYHAFQADLAHDFGLTVVHYHYIEKMILGDNVIEEYNNFHNQFIRHWRAGDYTAFDAEEGQTAVNVEQLIHYGYDRYGHEPLLYCDNNDYTNKYKSVKVPGKRFWIANYSSSPVNIKPDILWARQYTDGEKGPEPHYITGIGKSDCSVVTFGVASALALRKIRTRRRR